MIFTLILTESLIGSKIIQGLVGKVTHDVTQVPKKWGFKLAASFCKGSMNQKVFLMDEKIGTHDLLFNLNICGKCLRRGECNTYQRCLFPNKHFLARRNNLQVNHEKTESQEWLQLDNFPVLLEESHEITEWPGRDLKGMKTFTLYI